MGGIANMTTAPTDADAPVLRLSTMAIFGGVAISNEAGASMFDADLGEVIRGATEAAQEAAHDAVEDATAEAQEAASA
jgi:hypothetical protein